MDELTHGDNKGFYMDKWFKFITLAIMVGVMIPGTYILIEVAFWIIARLSG